MEGMQSLNGSSQPIDAGTSSVSPSVSSSVSSTMASNLQEKGKHLQETGRHYYEASKNYLSHALENPRVADLKTKASDFEVKLADQVRTKPIRSIAIGLAAGFVLGRMLRR